MQTETSLEISSTLFTPRFAWSLKKPFLQKNLQTPFFIFPPQNKTPKHKNQKLQNLPMRKLLQIVQSGLFIRTTISKDTKKQSASQKRQFTKTPNNSPFSPKQTLPLPHTPIPNLLSYPPTFPLPTNSILAILATTFSSFSPITPLVSSAKDSASTRTIVP